MMYSRKKYGQISEYSHRSTFNAITDNIELLPNGELDYLESIGEGATKYYEKLSDGKSVYFIDKTPRYYLIIDEIAKAFPHAKFIFLFRNPLDVISSILLTWTNNSLNLGRNYVDINKGPKMLAEGYELIKDKSLRVNYENLISDPNATLSEICRYLDIEYTDDLIEQFSNTELKGNKGDPTGQYKYDEIHTKNTNKIRKVIKSKYRKKYLRKFIRNIGVKNLKTMGYDADELISQINEVQVSNFKYDAGSRMQSFITKLIRYFDYQSVRVKLEDRLINKTDFQRYS